MDETMKILSLLQEGEFDVEEALRRIDVLQIADRVETRCPTTRLTEEVVDEMPSSIGDTADTPGSLGDPINAGSAFNDADDKGYRRTSSSPSGGMWIDADLTGSKMRDADLSCYPSRRKTCAISVKPAWLAAI